MDKELLRVVIIAAGLFVVLIMLAWHYFKNRKSSESSGFFFDQGFVDEIDESLIVHNENDDFDVVPVKPNKVHDDELFAEEFTPEEFDLHEEEEQEPLPRFVAPEIIQFSIIAKSSEGFNGLDLVKAFRIAQLQYGNMSIYERLDADDNVEFGVACMVEPGTFPDNGLADFYCPGIVFFMQPGMLDEPLKVFDELLEAVHLVAAELDGDILDHVRKPLTNNTIQLIRQSL